MPLPLEPHSNLAHPYSDLIPPSKMGLYFFLKSVPVWLATAIPGPVMSFMRVSRVAATEKC